MTRAAKILSAELDAYAAFWAIAHETPEALPIIEEDPMLSDDEARMIASYWHGGQSSPLYALSSTGTITAEALDEIADCLLHVTNEAGRSELEQLAAYVAAHQPPAVWVVIENTPGYMPEEDDPATFTDLKEAVAYAKERVAEVVEWYADAEAAATIEQLSPTQWFVVNSEPGSHDLGRAISVEPTEEV